MSLFCDALVSNNAEEFEETIAKPWGEEHLQGLSAMCNNVSCVEPDFDIVPKHEVESLLQESFVTHLDRDPCLVDAEPLFDPEVGGGFSPEALTTPPVRLELTICALHEPGRPVRVQGPHCIFETNVPDDAAPGDSMMYYLGPLPEYEVTVPPHNTPGSYVNITRDDGSSIRVSVPPDCMPGDTFCVEPPVLMVKVPEDCGEGDDVYFIRNGGWLRAKVPSTLRPGGYFPARLPPPGCNKGRFVPRMLSDDEKSDCNRDGRDTDFFSY